MGSHYVILNDLEIKSHYSNWEKKIIIGKNMKHVIK